MNTLKFYYNGIKVNSGPLIKCHYSIDNHITNQRCVTIFAKEYDQQLPKELNPKNDSDYMTDYVVKDVARVFPNSPYFHDARKAALPVHIKQSKSSLANDIERYNKRGEEIPEWIICAQARIAEYEKELKKLTKGEQR